MKLSLAILTLNELVGLKETLAKIPASQLDEIFAIDGGSTDGTIEFLKENNIKTYIQNTRGRGEAFRLAFEKAQGDAVLFFSPDGNEDPGDIPKFRQLLDQGADLVIGTRMVKGAHNEEAELILKWRKWANNIFNALANATWNKGAFVSDTINGYRAIKKAAWLQMRPNGNGYSIEYQTSIRAFKLKLKILEFPTFEAPRIDQKGGSPSIRTGVTMLKMYFSELIQQKL